MGAQSQGTGDPIHFTIAPLANGFTDQLLQFAGLYRLGRSLGWTYRHTRFASPFSSPPPPRPGSPSMRSWLAGLPEWLVWRGLRRGLAPIPEIYEFLGFNRYFQERDEMSAYRADRLVDLPITDRWLHENGADTPQAIQKLVAERAAALQVEGEPRPVRLRSPGSREFFGTILSGIPAPPDGPDLRAIYEKARRREPWSSLYPGGRLRILLHMRQGDTAALETPWGGWLPLWPRRPNEVFREYESLAAVPGRRHLRISDFVPIAEAFADVLAPRSYSMLAFSDGFARSFAFLRAIRNRVALPPERLDALLASESRYERSRFRSLARIRGCRCILGESPRNLCDFVESVLRADVVVFGGQQRLVPKILTHYCAPESMPLAIVLHRGGKFGKAPDEYYRILGSGAERFVSMDARKPDPNQLARILEGRFGASPRFRAAQRR